MSKQNLLAALRTFARQRPGLEFGNYGDWKAYRSEMRDITRDLKQAQELIQAVRWRDSITVQHILDAAKHSFSGRLSIVQDGDTFRIDYCTGQYFPTEYRKAVCAVMSSALWGHWRENGHCLGSGSIRETARRELGRSIASRWFN